MRWSVSLRTVVQPLGLSLDLCFHSSYFTTFFTTHDSYFAFYAPGPFNCGHGSFCVYPCLVTLWNIHCLAFCSHYLIGFCAVMYILKSIWWKRCSSFSTLAFPRGQIHAIHKMLMELILIYFSWRLHVNGIVIDLLFLASLIVFACDKFKKLYLSLRYSTALSLLTQFSDSLRV